MRALYHVHDNRPLVCNRRHEDGKPRVYRLSAARACPNGKPKRLCDGQALGVQCLDHWKDVAETGLSLRDPQPMYFDRTR